MANSKKVEISAEVMEQLPARMAALAGAVACAIEYLHTVEQAGGHATEALLLVQWDLERLATDLDVSAWVNAPKLEVVRA